MQYYVKAISLKYIGTYYKMKNEMVYKINFKSFMHDVFKFDKFDIFNYT